MKGVAERSSVFASEIFTAVFKIKFLNGMKKKKKKTNNKK